ncbi:MAG: hypothetical protein HUK40_12140 [Desulfobacter sp.]|nr:hypothetical protein [Desulfobacter sp.]
MEKLIALDTKADKIYPVRIPKVPRGKYMWNSAIQYDMGDQMGIVPHYQYDPAPVSFVNVRVQDPNKLAAFGFPGYEKNDTSCQLVYNGGGQWEFNPGNGLLIYKNGQWSAGSPPGFNAPLNNESIPSSPIAGPPIAQDGPESTELAPPSAAEPSPMPNPLDPEKKALAEDPLLLFPNSDFEMGDLTHWTPEGNAFEFAPTQGDNPTARGRKTMPSHHQKKFWIGTFEKYQGNENQRPGSRQGDRPVGTLTSADFTIKGDQISFLIGGGHVPDKETVSLVVEGKTIFSATGKNNETMTRKIWDVSEYKGKTAKICIKDNHAGGWGHINADDFRYTNIKKQTP